MIFFIKEWPNRTATLMADNGAVLWTFSSVAEARKVCDEWYKVQGEQVNYRLYTLDDTDTVREYEAMQDLSSACCAVA